MVKFILSRLHPRPERRGFTLHMDKKRIEYLPRKKLGTLCNRCVDIRLIIDASVTFRNVGL